MIKELPFSKNLYDAKQFAIKKNLPEPEVLPPLEEGKVAQPDIRGFLYAKAEWRGEGPEMPPIKAENIFKRKGIKKDRKQYNQEECRLMLLKEMYIDVNDPRNEALIRLLRETKNGYLLQLLEEDSKNPLFMVEPFRHKLLKARPRDTEL